MKSLLIQAENDLGDVSEMLQGKRLGGLGTKTAQEATSALQGEILGGDAEIVIDNSPTSTPSLRLSYISLLDSVIYLVEVT